MARPGFRQHPKFKRLVYLLGEPEPHVLGYLELLWEVGYTRGDPYIGDAIDIGLASQYPGDAEKFTKALLTVRLIDEVEPGKYEIHDLMENAPDYVKTRMRVRHYRERKKGESGDTGNADVPEQSNGNVTVTLPKRSGNALPNPIQPKDTLSPPTPPNPGESERKSPQLSQPEAETRLDMPDEPPKFRSSLACDNPELAAIASRVVKFYQQTTGVPHTERGGQRAIIEQLQRGRTEAVLRNAATGYAVDCLRKNREPRFRESVKAFYSEGSCDQYLSFDPKALQAEQRRREDQLRRERENRQPRGPTVGGAEILRRSEAREKQDGGASDSASSL